jgi:hypothetical protein
VKAFRNFAHFLKVYWTVRTQANPENIEIALGKPATLELTNKQALLVQDVFCRDDSDPIKVLKAFFNAYPRPGFAYFKSLSADGKALEFTDAEPFTDGLDIIDAAMRKLGAKYKKDDGEWYYLTAHPMVRRMVDAYEKQDMDKVAELRQKGGVSGVVMQNLDILQARLQQEHSERLKFSGGSMPNIDISGS